MHVDEVITDGSLVGRLLAVQFPQWADLPVEPVRSAGTDNALYRLGDDMVVRLPRISWATGQVDKENEWLPTKKGVTFRRDQLDEVLGFLQQIKDE